MGYSMEKFEFELSRANKSEVDMPTEEKALILVW